MSQSKIPHPVPIRHALRPRWFVPAALVVILAAGYVLHGAGGQEASVAQAASVGADRAVAAAQFGTFIPTKEQWAGLKVAAVQDLPFHSTLTTDGAIAFNDDTVTPVFSPYSGRVTRIYAQVGDYVRAGVPLMAVAASEAVQAHSDLLTAKTNFDTARVTEQRQHDLYQVGAAALKDWQQSQSDLAVARTALTAARDRLRVLGRSDADIDRLEKDPVGTPEAVVRSPIAGTVTQRQVGLGQFVTSAATGASSPVFTVGNLATVWLVANVREADAQALHVGQSVEVRVLALPERTFLAKLAMVGAAVDPNTRRLPVRAVVQNSENLLKPAMFANFTIATSAVARAPAVPASAIVYEEDNARVYVVNGDGTVSTRVIRTGRTSGGMIEVRQGLKAGDRVVTSGTLFIDRAVEGD